ncbi:kinase RLK-Pelle-LRR-XI-1 family protein [Tanacetum coccineum]
MESCYLEGSIPEQIGMLSNLAHLSLHGNYLNVTTILLGTNKLNGSIPQELSNLQNLEVLNLGDNDLGGQIPSSFGNLRALKFLNLGMNHISGPIPLNTTNLKYLEHIDLSKNHMTGVVKTLKACTMLHYLDLSSNNFVGEALTYEDFFYLMFLNQSQNHFTIVRTPIQKLVHHLVIILPVIVASWFLFLGYVCYYRHKATNDKIEPETIKHGDVCAILNYDGTIAYEDFISATEDFDLKYCIGTGGYGSVYEAKLPSGKTFALKKLHRFEAKQPEFDQKANALGDCNEADAYGPYDLGSLDFSSFPNLERFIIDRCHLEGSIPGQWYAIKSCAILSLTWNNLNGTLPFHHHSYQIRELESFGNNFTSTIPSQIGNLKNLLHLDLNHNQFTGLIPSSLGSMVNLTYLDLSHNQFTGLIPSSLGSMVNLTYLDLSHNQFTGLIPSSLGSMVNLTYLDLSDNQFYCLIHHHLFHG